MAVTADCGVSLCQTSGLWCGQSRPQSGRLWKAQELGQRGGVWGGVVSGVYAEPSMFSERWLVSLPELFSTLVSADS